MIIYNCQTCKKDNRCSLQNNYARIAFFSFGKGVDVPDCDWYQADYWHGVEGIMDSHCSDSDLHCH